MKIALVANTSWYLYNFRSNLMNALHNAGHEVVAIAPTDSYSQKLTEAGFSHRPIRLDGGSVNPFLELLSLVTLHHALRSERVNVVLSFTPKGNIYSGLSLVGQSTRLIANISGLGRAFAQGSPFMRLVRVLFKQALSKASAILFQNVDDLEFMTKSGLVDAKRSERIPGSGVDLSRFTPSSAGLRSKDEPTVFLLVARLLWAKGVKEFVDAARHIKESHANVRFQVLGPLDTSKAGVPRQTLESWVCDGVIEYLGVSDDVRNYLTAADCIVLPTYYKEGVPRVLLEAAAMAKPIIATNVAGSRDAVSDGVTGFLCRPQNVTDLVSVLERFIKLTTHDREKMGLRGREKMENEFDERFVIDRYLQLVSQRTN